MPPAPVRKRRRNDSAPAGPRTGHLGLALADRRHAERLARRLARLLVGETVLRG